MLTELPGDMKFNGDLSCTNNALVKLPDNLTVNGHLYCYSNMLTELPKGLYVKQSIYAGENLGWLVLPKDAVIGGNLYNSWKSI